jgi:hypothetical protein
MKLIGAASILVLAIGATGAAQAQGPPDYKGASAYPATPGSGFRLDEGCLKGVEKGGEFPTRSYDPRTKERVIANISSCSGGWVKGYNEATGAHWNMDALGDGSANGRDEDGHAWRFDPKTKAFTNLATNATCDRTDLRHVCATPN